MQNVIVPTSRYMCPCWVSNLFSTQSPLNFGSACWSMRAAVAPCMNKCYWPETVGWTGGFHRCQGYCSRCSLTHETTPAPGHVQRYGQCWYWKSLNIREDREFDFTPCKFAIGHQSSIVRSVTRSQHSCSQSCFLPLLTVERQEMCKCVVEKARVKFHLLVSTHQQYSSCEIQNCQAVWAWRAVPAENTSV